jgi:hypothetical protein
MNCSIRWDSMSTRVMYYVREVNMLLSILFWVFLELKRIEKSRTYLRRTSEISSMFEMPKDISLSDWYMICPKLKSQLLLQSLCI